MSRSGLSPEALLELEPGRFVVGIDLGTTNSAVCFVDTHRKKWRVDVLAVPQLVAPGQVERRDTLPSFHFEPAPEQYPPASLKLPWQSRAEPFVVGVMARDEGAEVPGRQIISAKSWLCHSGVDRTADLLPWQGSPDVTRLSPVEVSARYLRHVRQAWDAEHPGDLLEKQDVILTLPASFDEVARELTVEAAARAGLARVVLIEEPQAAFYAWVYRHRDDWESRVQPGQKILVCDIGGGTTDLTLIRVRSGEDGKVRFHRVAVGEHLILGGDNMDLTLAQFIEQKISGQTKGRLDARRWSTLVRRARVIKETLLDEDDRAPERLSVSLPAVGSRLIGGSMQTELTREEVRHLLADGFFPTVDLSEKAIVRGSGFQEFGLPYAADAAMTRYLASFLTAHRHAGDEPGATAETGGIDPARPDILLVNGGVFNSPLLRRRLIESLESWFRRPEEPDWSPVMLDNDRLDLAVARGAAYFGMVRRGQGVRIAAGLARTYYIGIAGREPQAICLLPAGIEPGHDVTLSDRRFQLLVSEPVEFPLFVSSVRLTDRVGEIVPIDPEQITPLPPIRTVLRTRKRGERGTVEVTLQARLTEIGTIELWCVQLDADRRWRLQFDVRSATRTDAVAHRGEAETEGFLDEDVWTVCERAILDVFGDEGTAKPGKLIHRLTEATGMTRDQWPSSLLRRMWETLIDLEPARRRSPAHEARWLNLLGFSLRPGYGLAMDDWRVAETWRIVQGRIVHAAPDSRIEGWILWRRLAGGLSAGQQQAVADPLLAPLRDLHRQATTGKGRGADAGLRLQESGEPWRLLGSLELISNATKIELGGMIFDLLDKRKMEPVRSAMIWTLGRLGTRTPSYGPLNTVLPVEVIRQWLENLEAVSSDDSSLPLTLMQLARRTDDRYRDLPEAVRDQVADRLEYLSAPGHYIELVRRGGSLDAEERSQIFGESLPIGLRLG